MQSSLRVLLVLCVVILTGVVVGSQPVAARDGAPQALALVSTEQPVAVTCSNGECRVRLTSFCLERDRDAPQTGQVYRLAAGSLTLVVQDWSGSQRVPLSADVLLTADRGHRSVTLRLPPGSAERWPDAALALEVAPMTTLMPAHDGIWSDQHDAAEVAAVVGPLRAVGQRTVEGADAILPVVRLLNEAVNRLPVVVSSDQEESERIWQQILAEAPDDAVRPLAAEAFQACHQSTRQGVFYDIRNCFILRHDHMMDGLNEDYWRAVAGS